MFVLYREIASVEKPGNTAKKAFGTIGGVAVGVAGAVEEALEELE